MHAGLRFSAIAYNTFSKVEIKTQGINFWSQPLDKKI